MTENLQDLVVYLQHGNEAKAESILEKVSKHLKKALQNGGNESPQREQQTMFAIDEVRLLLSAGDRPGAVSAARDAVREWKSPQLPRK